MLIYVDFWCVTDCHKVSSIGTITVRFISSSRQRHTRWTLSSIGPISTRLFHVRASGIPLEKVLLFSPLLSSTFAALCHVASLFCFFFLQRAVGFSYAFAVKNTDFTKKYTMYVQSPKASANYLRALFANDTVLPYVCNVDFNRNSSQRELFLQTLTAHDVNLCLLYSGSVV